MTLDLSNRIDTISHKILFFKGRMKNIFHLKGIKTSNNLTFNEIIDKSNDLQKAYVFSTDIVSTIEIPLKGNFSPYNPSTGINNDILLSDKVRDLQNYLGLDNRNNLKSLNNDQISFIEDTFLNKVFLVLKLNLESSTSFMSLYEFSLKESYEKNNITFPINSPYPFGYGNFYYWDSNENKSRWITSPPISQPYPVNPYVYPMVFDSWIYEKRYSSGKYYAYFAFTCKIISIMENWVFK